MHIGVIKYLKINLDDVSDFALFVVNFLDHVATN